MLLSCRELSFRVGAAMYSSLAAAAALLNRLSIADALCRELSFRVALCESGYIFIPGGGGCASKSLMLLASSVADIRPYNKYMYLFNVCFLKTRCCSHARKMTRRTCR